jgi:hypothetical protein
MNEGSLPGSWLACPRRERAPLARAEESHRGYVLSLIDGRRSLENIVAIFEERILMTHDEAQATICSWLSGMCHSSGNT